MAKSAEFPLSLIIRAVDNATAPLRKVNAEIAKTTEPIRTLGASLSAFGKESGLTRLGGAFAGVGKSIMSVGREAVALGLKLGGIAVAGGFALFHIVKSAVEAGDKLSEMAQRVGLSVDAYAQLGFAAAQADVDQEQFNASMDQFNKRLGEMKAGGGPLLEFLKKVSPALAHQVRGAKGTEEAFGLMTRAMEKVTDPGKRAALAAAAFGKSGLQMGQFLGTGTAAIEEQRKKYLALAGSQKEFADKSSEVDNAMREAEVAFTGARNAIALQFYPALTTLSKAVAGFLAKNRDGLRAWAEKTGKAIQSWVEGGGLERLTKNLGDIATTIGTVVDKLGGMQGALIVVAAFMAGPMALSTLGLVGNIAKLGFSLLAFLSNVSGLTVWAQGWVSYLWMMRAGLLASLGPALAAAAPFLAFAAALTAVSIAIIQVWRNWETLKQSKFSDIGAWLKDIVGLGEGQEIVAKGFVGRPSTGAAGAAGANGGTQAKVTVDFNNAPPGTRVTQDKANTAAVDTSVGVNMLGN